MNSTVKRIQKEIKDYHNTTYDNFKLIWDHDNIYKCSCSFNGPIDSPYTGGVFHLDITIPRDYPFKPPIVICLTPIYHPNFNQLGQICVDILKDNWSPALTIPRIVLSIVSLLTDPNSDNPLDLEIADVYKHNLPTYIKTAHLWTRKYASS